MEVHCSFSPHPLVGPELGAFGALACHSPSYNVHSSHTQLWGHQQSVAAGCHPVTNQSQTRLLLGIGYTK